MNKAISNFKLKILLLFFMLSITLFAEVKNENKYIDFSLLTIESKKIKLSDIVGKKIVLLNFWASWCPYCVAEIPQLKRLYTKYKDKGLEIVAVNILENKNVVSRFVKKNKITYFVVLDTDGKVAQLYNVRGIPQNFLIDTKGKIVYIAHQLPPEEVIKTLITTLKPEK